MSSLRPVAVPMHRIVHAGTAAWLVALAVTLIVPSLHEGPRQWWPWACVAGAVMGLAGSAYLWRGRGNAEQATLSD